MRCDGRTDDMLIYKAMNVFPTAIREVMVDGFADVVEPYMRILKDHPDQVRFDAPIPVEIEASQQLEPAAYEDLATRIADEVRRQLQVRVDVSVVLPGSLPRSAYKTALVHVRGTEA